MAKRQAFMHPCTELNHLFKLLTAEPLINNGVTCTMKIVDGFWYLRFGDERGRHTTIVCISHEDEKASYLDIREASRKYYQLYDKTSTDLPVNIITTDMIMHTNYWAEEIVRQLQGAISSTRSIGRGLIERTEHIKCDALGAVNKFVNLFHWIIQQYPTRGWDFMDLESLVSHGGYHLCHPNTDNASIEQCLSSLADKFTAATVDCKHSQPVEISVTADKLCWRKTDDGREIRVYRVDDGIIISIVSSPFLQCTTLMTLPKFVKELFVEFSGLSIKHCLKTAPPQCEAEGSV